MGADSLTVATAASLREGVRAVKQHRRLPQCFPEDHSANHSRERSKHVDSDEGARQLELGVVDRSAALRWQLADTREAEAADQHTTGIAYVGQAEEEEHTTTQCG